MADSPLPHQELPTDRAGAAILGFDKYFTGTPCKRGHLDARYAKCAACVSCAKERAVAWKEKNVQKARDSFRRWRAANLDRAREISRDNTKRWRDEYPERARKAWKNWRQNNPEKARASRAHRRAARIQRTPPWVDIASIQAVYLEANRLTAETGVEHHVDHFYPLRGETVSGLHVPENLRAIPALENLSKSNRVPGSG